MGDKLDSREGFGLGPYKSAIAPTASDTVDDPAGVAQAIVCMGSAGNVSFVTANGETVTWAIATGWSGMIEMRVKRVRSTGTSATSLFLLYV